MNFIRLQLQKSNLNLLFNHLLTINHLFNDLFNQLFLKI